MQRMQIRCPHEDATAAFSDFSLRPGFKKVSLQDPCGRSDKTMQNMWVYTLKRFHVDGPLDWQELAQCLWARLVRLRHHLVCSLDRTSPETLALQQSVVVVCLPGKLRPHAHFTCHCSGCLVSLHCPKRGRYSNTKNLNQPAAVTFLFCSVFTFLPAKQVLRQQCFAGAPSGCILGLDPTKTIVII